MANDDEDSQRRWDHVRQPLSSREVQTRSLEDMHYQQLNDNFPPFLAQPFGLQYRDWKQKFLPPVYCEGLLCRGARHTDSFSLYGHGSLAACSPCAGGGKWFGKKGCSMTGTISVVRPPPGTATFKNIKAGDRG